jgi:hypothetical protein
MNTPFLKTVNIFQLQFTPVSIKKQFAMALWTTVFAS